MPQNVTFYIWIKAQSNLKSKVKSTRVAFCRRYYFCLRERSSCCFSGCRGRLQWSMISNISTHNIYLLSHWIIDLGTGFRKGGWRWIPTKQGSHCGWLLHLSFMHKTSKTLIILHLSEAWFLQATPNNRNWQCSVPMFFTCCYRREEYGKWAPVWTLSDACH